IEHLALIRVAIIGARDRRGLRDRRPELRPTRTHGGSPFRTRWRRRRGGAHRVGGPGWHGTFSSGPRAVDGARALPGIECAPAAASPIAVSMQQSCVGIDRPAAQPIRLDVVDSSIIDVLNSLAAKDAGWVSLKKRLLELCAEYS